VYITYVLAAVLLITVRCIRVTVHPAPEPTNRHHSHGAAWRCGRFCAAAASRMDPSAGGLTEHLDGLLALRVAQPPVHLGSSVAPPTRATPDRPAWLHPAL